MLGAALSEIRQLAAQGQLELARQRFRELAESRLQSQGGHRELALVAEELGLVGLAEREFNLALRDDPEDIEALRHLVDLAEEKGAVERAINLLVRLMELSPEPAVAVKLYELYLEIGAQPKAEALAEKCRTLGIRLPRSAPEAEPPVAEPIIPPDADLVRFLSLFGGREDVYARQWFSPAKGEGGYSPVRQPLTPRELRAHLLGEVTLGVYPIRLDGTCLFCALDLDLRKSSMEEARRSQALASLLKEQLKRATEAVRNALEQEGLTPIVEDSGYKGRHFWFPLAAPEPAGTLVAFGKAVLDLVTPHLGEHLACEWFPKASRPGTKGLGNLIKLPLGIHRRTGRRSCFLDREGNPIANPFEFLRTAPLLGRQAMLDFLDRRRLAAAEPEPPPPEEQAPEAPASVALPPPPSWSACDFETAPAFRAVLGGCAVLRALVTQALQERRLSYDEVMTVVHTFGYLPQGVAAANYLFDLVGTVPNHARLKSPLRGNPMSCIKIRSRIPHVTSKVPCNCVFPEVQDLYPTPLLHLRGKAGEEPPPAPSSLEDLVRKLQKIQNQINVWQADLAALRQAIVARLKQEPQPYLDFGDVTLRVETRDGVDTLILEPRKAPS